MLIPPNASWMNDFSNKTHNLIDTFHNLQKRRKQQQQERNTRGD